LAEQADRPLRSSGESQCLERLQAEAGNTAAAMRWYVGIETFDDTAAQIAWSHHWMRWTGTWCATPRPTGTCGRPNWT
jgi:hypothetical protein